MLIIKENKHRIPREFTDWNINSNIGVNDSFDKSPINIEFILISATYSVIQVLYIQCNLAGENLSFWDKIQQLKGGMTHGHVANMLTQQIITTKVTVKKAAYS